LKLKAYKEYFDNFSTSEEWQSNFDNKRHRTFEGSKNKFVSRGVRLIIVFAGIFIVFIGTAFAFVNTIWKPVGKADTNGTIVFVPLSEEYFSKVENGFLLFERNGERVGIRLDDDPIELTDNHIEEMNYADTIEDAITVLGQHFRLPTAYTENLLPPEFNIQIDEIILQRHSVYVRLSGDPAIFFYVEKNRDGDPWFLPLLNGCTITNAEILGIVVYKLSDDNLNRYYWEHEELTYMLFQNINEPSQFSDEQMVEIIISMIE